MLILYVLITIYAFYLSYTGKAEPESFKYVLTFITGLVGGIVALGFGVQPPSSSGGAPLINTPNVSKSRLKFQGLNRLLKPADSKALGFTTDSPTLAYYYALIYIILGVIAVALWVIWNDKTAVSISQMASTFLGMASAILMAFFRNGTN